MKYLTLIRHAKSDWNHPGLDDHDRPLNDRGRRNLPLVAAALAAREIRPGLVVVSTAERTRATVAGLQDALEVSPAEVVYRPDVYLATRRELVGIIASLDESLSHAVLIGHNPGMGETVDYLARGETCRDFPTLAVARLELEVDYWGEVGESSARLVELLTPRTLEEA